MIDGAIRKKCTESAFSALGLFKVPVMFRENSFFPSVRQIFMYDQG